MVSHYSAVTTRLASAKLWKPSPISWLTQKSNTVKSCVPFGPDEEIGTGADHFDVKQFPVDFAYTIDGESLGQLEYETFNAAGGTVTLQRRIGSHGYSKGYHD